MRRLLAIAVGSALAVGAAQAVAAPAPFPGASAPATQILPQPGADLTKLALGDAYVTTSGPGRVGWTWSCSPGNPGAPGASKDGPWLSATTWNLVQKLAVSGSVSWKKKGAAYSEGSTAATRTITTMSVPTIGTTGNFPIAPSDPAYEYDRNPGTVAAKKQVISIARNPVRAVKSTCLPMGAIGVARNGVLLYNALDARGMDARAHEVLDSCEGHPSPLAYHYHAGSACVLGTNSNADPNSAVLFGYAFDGFGIYVERDKNGNMLTNKDLDACHGRTSPITWDGKKVNMYHYVVTQGFPYLLGCFAGSNTASFLSARPR